MHHGIVNERSRSFANEHSLTMTPRRRAIPDTTIIDHACELLIDRGRDAVTFAQVAERCGLAPPTLVQRFVSREAMLAAVVLGLTRQLPSAFAAPSPSRLDGLTAGLVRAAPLIGAALSLGQGSGSDRFCLELRKQISYGLAAAVEAGELPHCDVARLTRTIQISAIGAVAAARLEAGDVAHEITQALQAQLDTYV